MGVLTSIIDRSISGSFSSDVFNVGRRSFSFCTGLTSVSFPNATRIDSSAFQSCGNLASISFPNVLSIGNYAFAYCSSLKGEVSLPNAMFIGNYAFTESFIEYTYPVNALILPRAYQIGEYAFAYCNEFARIDVGADNYPICKLGYKAFYRCKNLIIRVPPTQVDTYKTATNWSEYSMMITTPSTTEPEAPI